ncbi:hypothetical protein ACFU99_03405 [Streptomyces sp. NPDC057654]|uniref:hypothetical protein n=1 Tax=Streptomyces sp. NPDC057654 TaxID=3346196 RepID=UPI0036BC0CEE
MPEENRPVLRLVRKDVDTPADLEGEVVDAVIRSGGAWRIAPTWWLPASEYRTDRAAMARVRSALGRLKWLFS